jgi:hypothetical protein
MTQTDGSWVLLETPVSGALCLVTNGKTYTMAELRSLFQRFGLVGWELDAETLRLSDGFLAVGARRVP